MEKTNENLDSPNEDKDVAPEIEENDNIDALKEKYQNLSETNKKLFARAKKAEGFELKDGDWVKKPEPKKDDIKKDEPDANKSDELNEGQIALLTVKGYDHEEDVSFIQKEMAESNKTLGEVLEMNYIKENLKELKKAREVKDATPEGNKRSLAGVKDSVDYWVSKGEMPPNTPENTELRRKIVNQRVNVDKQGRKFSDTPLIQ